MCRVCCTLNYLTAFGAERSGFCATATPPPVMCACVWLEGAELYLRGDARQSLHQVGRIKNDCECKRHVVESWRKGEKCSSEACMAARGVQLHFGNVMFFYQCWMDAWWTAARQCTPFHSKGIYTLDLISCEGSKDGLLQIFIERAHCHTFSSLNI